MPTPLPLPVRVLVKGASTVNWISWMGGPREDFIFPRAIQAGLHERGRPSEVQAVTMTSEKTETILRTWQREVLGFSPDVIVLVYGHYETIHLFLPRWLERHANSLRARPRALPAAYRRMVLKPGWLALVRLQARIDARLEPTLRRSRPRRVAADLEAYLRHVRKVGSPVVYLFEILPPASRYRSWFPGMTRRVEVMNAAIRGLVDRLDDPDIRYVPVGDLARRLYGDDLDAATPDGFHYSPELHGLIGSTLAAEIDAWAATQNHLSKAPEPL